MCECTHLTELTQVRVQVLIRVKELMNLRFNKKLLTDQRRPFRVDSYVITSLIYRSVSWLIS
jgi:hypothetical protein